VVVDPADYVLVLAALRQGRGRMEPALLRALAAKAFAHTAAYDSAIAAWFEGERRALPQEPRFPNKVAVAGDKLQDLRYGENPHQEAAFYRAVDASGPSLANAKVLGGKELSYNNLLDLDAALAAVLEHTTPACVIVKHNNPCGAATAGTQTRAFELALQGDPVSAFGGIVAFNAPLSAETARAIVQSGTFTECLVAPEVPEAALAELHQAKWGQSVRVLSLGGLPAPAERRRAVLRQVSGGFLLQTPDLPAEAPGEQVATRRAPTAAERAALQFAWRVCQHVKSNAIVLVRATDDGGLCTVGIGAGQMSRVDAAKIACDKASERARGSVLASDAFFPFPDGLEVCARAGATAAIQPGGSKKDPEVIAAADAAGMAMVFTGQRHFRH
jgi:phosphoribosylaminoimidazolecarboxamide formyltransferase/IMP cyclohydrolase